MGETRAESAGSPNGAFADPEALRAHGAPSPLILGYAEPWVVRPGERVAVHVGGDVDSYAVALLELTGADPEGGVHAREIDRFEPRRADPDGRRWAAGSHVSVGPSEEISALRSFTAGGWVYPTLLTREPQTLFSTLGAGGGWAVVIAEDGGLALRVGTPDGHTDIDGGVTVGPREWTFVSIACDADAGSVRFTATPRDGVPKRTSVAFGAPPEPGESVLRVAAPHGGDRPVRADGNGCFNGKVSGPFLRSAAVGEPDEETLRRGQLGELGHDLICAPELAEAIDGSDWTDRSAKNLRVTVVNSPTSGVTGPEWRGGVSAYVQNRSQYSALHFHDDDLDDACWPVGAELEIPADARSGMYAARLGDGDSEDLVPFFVTAPGTSTAEAVLLLPTLTYLAYADEHEILSNPPSYTAFTGADPSDAPLGWRDWLAVDSGLLSLYDVHRDGSTVPFASTRRPLLNLRPDYVWPLLDAPHGPGMDLRLIGWMRELDLGFDVLTDHDLDAFGLEAIEPYRVLITGAHPEYWTAKMLDALDRYLGAGGRVAYLGGNGFHGVTGIAADRPHVAEVRRPLFGSRPSSAEPGETWMTTTGEEGGTWRARGRSSHRTVGVGTAAMGAGPGRPYRRTEVSREPEYAWVFDGVDGEEIGADGGILGGAAAYEFDRADAALGTPAHAQVLASATGFERLYYPLLEDFMSSCPEVGDPGSDLVRADMVMAIRENGGGSFAAGSAAWCGSLGSKESPTDVGTVTANVLRRFTQTPRGESPLKAASA